MNTIVNIEGMSCQHCVNHTTEALKKLDGVTSVEVRLDEKKAEIESDEKLDFQLIKDTVAQAGYQVTGIESL
ncbi:MAG: cation transporter [Deltaproteobacteria bacterium]|nr:cation transporter [Deltaproteobacteria bacterium]